MYSTKSVNGSPAIQRNGRNILSVWHQDWDLAYDLCELLNRLEGGSELLLNDQDKKWLKAMDHAFSTRVQHA